MPPIRSPLMVLTVALAAGGAALLAGDPLAGAPLAAAPRPQAAQGPQAAPSPGARADGPWFVTHERCFACHTGLVDATGDDVSIGPSWRGSMMANSARDPYWQASVRGEVLDHPELQAAIEDTCATCHMPMARFTLAAHGAPGEVFAALPGAGPAPAAGGARSPGVTGDLAALAADGVSCTLCHQIRPDGLGEHDSFDGGFVIDTATPTEQRPVFGSREVDPGRATVMRSSSTFVPSRGAHLADSEMCASCHTLYTRFVDRDGEIAGELPEQVPYMEWRHSEFRGSRSCQDCHMPAARGPARFASVLGQEHDGFARHVFRGANAYMLGVLKRYRAELGVVATDAELDAAIAQTRANLAERTATLRIERVSLADGRLHAQVVVENLTGHKLPTAYPSRRVWLHVAVRDAAGEVVFESGAPSPEGWIAGNDNDEDPARYEPHRERIEAADQVQIYESMMVDTEGAVTTGLLYGARYVKDNRLLPRGFDKATAPADVAVQGSAGRDPDFVGGTDRVAYAVPVGDAAGPLTIEARLLYQSVSYRWARNLARHGAVEGATEISRFLGYYEATADTSTEILARTTGVLND